MQGLVIVGALRLVLLGLGQSLGFKIKLDREKLRPFECGFTPKTTNRVPLSLRFFLVAIIFLVFDVELALIFPVIMPHFSGSGVNPRLVILVFLSILLLGLYYEVNQGRLN